MALRLIPTSRFRPANNDLHLIKSDQGSPIKVDVRVIAATNKDLASEMSESRFREDLFYRLNVVPIRLPPLRERRDDIPPLIAHFVQQIMQRTRVHARGFEDDAVAALRARDWPGNVRELRNTVERLLILSSGDTVVRDDVMALAPGSGRDATAGFMSSETFETFKQEAEHAFLEAKLRENDWNVSVTARRLQMPRSNLYKKIEKYGLNRER